MGQGSVHTCSKSNNLSADKKPAVPNTLLSSLAGATHGVIMNHQEMSAKRLPTSAAVEEPDQLGSLSSRDRDEFWAIKVWSAALGRWTILLGELRCRDPPPFRSHNCRPNADRACRQMTIIPLLR